MPTFLLFQAQVAQVPAGRPDVVVGQVADFFTDGVLYQWIKTPQELADRLNVTWPQLGAKVVYHDSSSLPVGDLGCFGVPSDALTAFILAQPW